MGANSCHDLWREKLLAWKASGMSAQAWCHQQQIDYSVFGFWYRRLFPQEIPPKARYHPHLTDYPQLASGMIFERSGVLLHVPGEVNADSLLACLSMLSKLP